MNLAGQQTLSSFTTDYVKCFGKVDKGHVEVHILLLAFLLKLPCYEDYVNSSFVPPKSTFTVQGVHSMG